MNGNIQMKNNLYSVEILICIKILKSDFLKIVKMEQDLVEFRRAKFTQGTGEIYKKQEELFAPIKTKIYAAIEKVAKEEAMQFIFDKSGDIILLYADSAFDITFKVLDRLKRGN